MFASLQSNVISLFKGFLTEMAKMALSGEEGEGAGPQLPSK